MSRPRVRRKRSEEAHSLSHHHSAELALEGASAELEGGEATPDAQPMTAASIQRLGSRARAGEQPGRAQLVQRLQSTAGNQAVQRLVLQRDGATGTTLERLKEEADGSWIGNVDEEECLNLINQLTPAERSSAGQDSSLMRKLADAFNAREMVQAVIALGLPLKWKAYWLEVAEVAGDVGPVTWQTFFVQADHQQILEFLGWKDLFERCIPYLGTTPLLLFATQRTTAAFGQMMANSQSLLAWLVATTGPATRLQEIARAPMVEDADMLKIVQQLKAMSQWDPMLSELPKGAGLMPETRAALRRLASLLPMPDCGTLFEIRFKTPLVANNGVAWVADDVRAVWTQLDVLPDQDVSENTVLSAFNAMAGDAGTFSPGTGAVNLGNGLRTSTFHPEDPTLNGTLNPERLPHTVRHEVGHAVHQELGKNVNTWLEKEIQFWSFPEGEKGTQQFVESLGGFPATWKDKRGDDQEFGDTEKKAILQLIQAHSGNQAWQASQALPQLGSVMRDASLADGTPSAAEKAVLLWEAMPQPLRDALNLSSPRWYQNYATLPIGTKGYAFWNHWYGKPYYFSDAAKTAIDATQDNYSAMSEKEFFANCYAEYFSDPEGFTDPTKWGGSLADNIKEYFKRHVLERQPYEVGPDGKPKTPAIPSHNTGVPNPG